MAGVIDGVGLFSLCVWSRKATLIHLIKGGGVGCGKQETGVSASFPKGMVIRHLSLRKYSAGSEQNNQKAITSGTILMRGQ